MTTYRGIRKNEVLRSFEQGVKYLRALNIGLETNAELALWFDGREVFELSFIDNKKAFAQKMRETKACDLFKKYHQVLDLMAIADKSGEGHRIYTALSRWGAFQNVHVVQGTIEAQRFVKRKLKNLDTDYRYPAMKDTGSYIKFGVMMREGEKLQGMTQLVYAQISEEIEKWRATEELHRVYPGAITDDKICHGLYFEATPDIAQKIATLLPDRKVIYPDHKQIMPIADKKSFAKASSPQRKT